MKSIYFLISTMVLIPVLLSGQTSPVKPKYYDCWYFLIPSFSNPLMRNPITGYTYEFADTSVTIVAKNSIATGRVNSPKSQLVVPVSDIDRIYTRPKGQKAVGAILGVAVGATTGLIIGLSQKETNGYDGEGVGVFFTTLAGAGVGIALGLPLGSIKQVHRIKGDPGIYSQKRPELLKYSIKYYSPE